MHYYAYQLFHYLIYDGLEQCHYGRLERYPHKVQNRFFSYIVSPYNLV